MQCSLTMSGSVHMRDTVEYQSLRLPESRGVGFPYRVGPTLGIMLFTGFANEVVVYSFIPVVWLFK